MRIVVQRVRRAAVAVDEEVVGAIDLGLLVLVGVGRASTDADAAWLARKTTDLRIFADDEGRMNRSLGDVDGGVLAISQFTLYGEVAKGRRPSFVQAAAPAEGERLYRAYCDALDAPVARGVFGAHMVIEAVADGPVTIVMERTAGA